MIKKLIRSSIAVVVALSLTMMPNSFANANEKADIITASLSTTDNKYEEVIKKADIKAKILTSVYGATSLQYALIDDGEIVISGQSGVYSKDKTIPLTNKHMYGIGSVSKVFTTVAVMQLVEQGKVKLDTPIFKYIPELRMEDSRYKDITVRMLLNHSSGLMGSSFSNSMLFNDNDTISCSNLLNTLKTQRLKANPGEFSVYCNDGFSLAQLLVEKVSGISFSKYLDEFISNPLGMEKTKTPRDNFDENELVKTYLSGSNNALPIENVNALGAGGIYSTAEDLCHFAELFMKDTTSKVLTNTSAKAMAKSEYLNGIWHQEDDSSLSYGLGWDSVSTYPFTEYGIKALVKGGDTSLYHGSIIVLPEEGMAMAVLSSGGASTYNQLFAQEVLLDALLMKGSIEEIKANETFKAPIKVSMPEDLKRYAGYYAFTGGTVKIDISEDGVLSLYNNASRSLMSAQRFIYTGDGKFYYSDGSTYISFVKESNGNTYLYVAGYSLLPNIGQIASADYQAQKLTGNPISKKVKTAWEKRDNKKYFIINEKYSSQTYALGTPWLQISMLKELEGYLMNATIIDENTAKMLIQIPGMYGRDLSDYIFYNVNKVEYLKAIGTVFISETAIKALSTKASSKVTIGSEGYARWYKVSAKAGNNNIKVTLPKDASFTAYDINGTCLFNSLIAGQSTATLPADGYIVFVGKVGAKFTVRYVK
ncbi:MAG: serine hydrolase domain-containing protein [Mobilitalea sp.]